MATNNQESLIIYKEELRELIRSEVSKFRAELTVYFGENKKEINLEKKLFNIKQVAERYGVSKQTIFNWIKKGVITGFKQDKMRYFYLDELDQSLTRYEGFEMLQRSGEIPIDKTYTQFLQERRKK